MQLICNILLARRIPFGSGRYGLSVDGPSLAKELTSSSLWPSASTRRVVKWFGNTPAGKPTDPNDIEGFTAQDGTSAKGKMGACSEGFTTGSDDGENNGVGSCEAQQ